MKKQVICLATGIGLLMMTGMAHASLTTIGTAAYDSNGDGIIEPGENYNLIWDDDNNGNSIIWFDFTNDRANWSDQNSWASGLELNYNIDPAYVVSWDEDTWRLPSPGLVPLNGGYDQTTSEMGHLFYTEFGLTNWYDRGEQLITTAELNSTNFDNLTAGGYWVGNEEGNLPYGSWHWYMWMHSGQQGDFYDFPLGSYGISVRNAQVSAVPIPGAIWLLGSGLACLVGLRSRN